MLDCVSCPAWGISRRLNPVPPTLATSLRTSPFALAWVLSHAVTDLSEEEGDKSHDIIVLTFPACSLGCYDSLDLRPGFRRKQDSVNAVCVCTSNPSVACPSVDFWTQWPFPALSGAPKGTKFLKTLRLSLLSYEENTTAWPQSCSLPIPSEEALVGEYSSGMQNPFVGTNILKTYLCWRITCRCHWYPLDKQ